ncbi:MFS superfamily sulfate permease-like transporter [Streptacidiphilus sp. MAP12-16]|uniref:hypothetical protein n=1 Tax=Streptacidiphilus sp. MAP12-16 TaxID=3156300 RepID=UPI0035137FF0
MAYALVGSSRDLVVGPDGTLSALTATTVAPLALVPTVRSGVAAYLARSTERSADTAPDDPGHQPG